MDPFQPRSEPARTLYEAFQAEAAQRRGRKFPDWVVAEQEAVFRAAQDAAARMGLRAPTMAEVQAAEIYASGSTDYGAVWAQRLAQVMTAQAVDR